MIERRMSVIKETETANILNIIIFNLEVLDMININDFNFMYIFWKLINDCSL